MKFPKKKVLITVNIQEYVKNKDAYSIFNMKDEILENASILDKNIFDILILATFELGNFDQVIIIYSELKKQNIETFNLIYYTLLALASNNDFYLAMSIINKSEILNTSEIVLLHGNDGANYSNLVRYPNQREDLIRCLIIVNFVQGLFLETTKIPVTDSQYVLYRFFDLLNLIHELGFSLEIVKDLMYAMKIIFNMDV